MNQQAPPPDWYPDPENAGMLRYWDGNQWTEHRAPATPQPPPTQVQPPPAPQAWEYAQPHPQAQRSSTGLIVGGWIGVLLFPLAGLICGIILLTRGEQGHGIAITVLSALFIVVAIIVISAGNSSAVA